MCGRCFAYRRKAAKKAKVALRAMVVAGTNMPSAALFLLAVGPPELTVSLADNTPSPVPVACAPIDWDDVWFSNRMWGLLVAVGNVEVVVLVLVEEVEEYE
jgi:hypothetical protein